jgi:sirohydrochlorin ferrochelatase
MHARKPRARKPRPGPKTALVLIAHGSRQTEANADLFHVVVEMRRRRSDTIVEAAFLELADPSAETSAARCVRRGAERVILLPYFLSAGIHVQRDLTALCRRLSSAHPGVEFLLAKPLGRHPLLLEAVADRAREAEKQEPRKTRKTRKQNTRLGRD